MATPKKAATKKKAAPRKRVAKSKDQLLLEGKVRSATQKVVDARLAEGQALEDLAVSTAESWKGRVSVSGTKLPLPSGNVALVRNPGIEVFIEQGLIPNSLLPLIEDALKDGKGMSPKKVKEASTDMETVAQMVEMANAVVVYCVVAPQIFPKPLPAEDGTLPARDPAKFYVDEVDFDDKMFIFQWVVGGTKDLKRFRDQQAAALESLDAEPDVEEAS